MSDTGRLQVTQTMSGTTVVVPGEQHLLRAAYWWVWALGVVSSAVFTFTNHSRPLQIAVFIIAVGILAPIALGGWRLVSRFVEKMQHGESADDALLLLVLWLISTFVLISVTHPLLAILAGFANGLLWLGILRLIAPRAAVLTIDPSAVTVVFRRRRVSVPLEEIDAFQPSYSWRHPARMGAYRVSGLAALDEAEWRWLKQAIVSEAARRRHALLEEGHDLEAVAAPPAALEALTER